ncbi:MAG: permease [Desulfofustis sp.]|nr:permease [Desulfofustis sp.]
MESERLVPLIEESVRFFLVTMAELAVLFVGISFLVGIINEFLPQEKVRRWLSGRGGRGYVIGSMLGGLTPFCSCSTIPVTIGLLKAQAGFGPTMTFLFTSPLVNPIIVPLFLALLGPQVTAVYVVVAVTMAIGLGMILQRFGFARYLNHEVIFGNGSPGGCCAAAPSPAGAGTGRPAPQPLQMIKTLPVASCCAALSASAAETAGTAVAVAESIETGRWRRIFVGAVVQFRKLLPFILLGVAIGAVIHGFLPADLVTRLAGADNPLAVPIAAVAGIPLYLRISTMVPIAASLIAKGMSVGAVIALIIGGAGASLPEVAMLKGIFRLPLLLAFLGSVLATAVVAGYLVQVVIS